MEATMNELETNINILFYCCSFSMQLQYIQRIRAQCDHKILKT